MKYVRFYYQGGEAYGLLERDSVAVLKSDLFRGPKPAGARIPWPR